MAIQILNRIMKQIKDARRIIICRHIRPDGDAVGSSQALKRIIKLTWPEKEVYLINRDRSQHTEFLGPEDADIPEEMYKDATVVVLDTSTSERVSNPLYNKAECIIRIDHHIETDSFGTIRWVEKERSSVCEMVAEFYDEFSDELEIDSYAATCLYAGICTDSGNFKFSSTGPQTLRLAAMLLEKGVDTQDLYAKLDLVPYDYLKFKAHAMEQVNLSPAGVAWLYIPIEMRQHFSVSDEQASEAVDFMNCISGSPVWMVFIETEKHIRVRLRSRFVAINSIAEKYSGGGHANACGAKVFSKEEMMSLVSDADALLASFKASNPQVL